MQARLDAQPEAIRLRRQTVEHPFATLKAWMGATHFLTKRGRHKSAPRSACMCWPTASSGCHADHGGRPAHAGNQSIGDKQRMKLRSTHRVALGTTLNKSLMPAPYRATTRVASRAYKGGVV